MTSSFGNVDGKLVQYDREAGDKFTKGGSVTMPPYLEAVLYDGDTNRFYMIFESATPFTPLLQPEFMDIS